MTDLKTLALAANSAHPCVPWHDSDSLIALGIDDDCDAAFVAAASPDAILKLLEERDRLREALEAMLAIHTEPAGFEGQYGAKLTKFIEAQEVKVNAAISKAQQALEDKP